MIRLLLIKSLSLIHYSTRADMRTFRFLILKNPPVYSEFLFSRDLYIVYKYIYTQLYNDIINFVADINRTLRRIWYEFLNWLSSSDGAR